MVDDVLPDVLLRAGELVEAGADLGGQGEGSGARSLHGAVIRPRAGEFLPRGAQSHSFQGAVPGPEVVQRDRVLVGVQALPEPRVAPHMQLAVGGQALERLALQHARVAQVVEHRGFQEEEAAVDPVVRARLLVEAGDAVVVADLGRRRTAARAGRRPSWPGRRGGGGVPARRPGRCRPRRRRRSAQNVASPTRVARPVNAAAGGRVLAGEHALHAHAARATPPARRTARRPRSCGRSAARSGESPGRRRSGSRATRSVARRSRRAAWGASGCAPAGGFRDRRRGSAHRASGRASRRPYPRPQTRILLDKLRRCSSRACPPR